MQHMQLITRNCTGSQIHTASWREAVMCYQNVNAVEQLTVNAID